MSRNVAATPQAALDEAGIANPSVVASSNDATPRYGSSVVAQSATGPRALTAASSVDCRVGQTDDAQSATANSSKSVLAPPAPVFGHARPDSWGKGALPRRRAPASHAARHRQVGNQQTCPRAHDSAAATMRKCIARRISCRGFRALGAVCSVMERRGVLSWSLREPRRRHAVARRPPTECTFPAKRHRPLPPSPLSRGFRMVET
jgi:hypothetical protein